LFQCHNDKGKSHYFDLKDIFYEKSTLY